MFGLKNNGVILTVLSGLELLNEKRFSFGVNIDSLLLEFAFWTGFCVILCEKKEGVSGRELTFLAV